MMDAGSTEVLVYRIPCGLSRRGTARPERRDSGVWVSYPATRPASTLEGRYHHRAIKGDVMQPAITSEVVVAYAQCPRKAYLLLFSPEQGTPHEYVRILEQQRREHQARYLDGLQHTHADVHPYTVEHLRRGSTVLLNACLQADGLAAACDVLTRVERPPVAGIHQYAPTLCVGAHSVSTEQKLWLTCNGYGLGRLQHSTT